ncbi:MAG: hypothetical protein NTV30_10210 [Chloroflexi bacterium]|nr:hypothetical protein [Chloroflexota bacterium]
MSILINKLKNAVKGQTSSIGFASATSTTAIPSMVIIARMETIEKSELADALLIKVNELDANTLKQLSKITTLPWGIEISELTKSKVDIAFTKGCDYILVDNDSKTEFLLTNTALGKIVLIDSSLPNSLLVTLNNFPVDAVLLRFNHSLTIKDVMTCYQINNLVAKHLVVDLPAGLQEGDLDALYKAGVSGLILDWKQGSSTIFSDLRNKITHLPKRKPSSEKFSVSLPQIKQTEAPEEDSEEDFE